MVTGVVDDLAIGGAPDSYIIVDWHGLNLGSKSSKKSGNLFGSWFFISQGLAQNFYSGKMIIN